MTSALSHAATITWDDEATSNGNPEHSWHAKDNWSTDAVPEATDDVELLLPGTQVRLSATSATVKTIDSRIPFDLNETLIVSTLGTFEDSLVNGGLGRIRANGGVTFKGTNALDKIALEGSSPFTNTGTITFGTRGIANSTFFFNEGTFTLVSGLASLGQFENNGTFDLGVARDVNSSTVFTNYGTIRKTDKAQESQFLGKLIQEEGTISIGSNATLTIGGLQQSYKGGTIVADGTVNLQLTSGGDPTLEFDGMVGFTGEGTVNQVANYTVKQDITANLPNTPGYQLGDLVFERQGLDSPFPTFTNAGYLTIKGTPDLLESTLADKLSRFINLTGATVSQAPVSNPDFAIKVGNAGTWTTYGMRIFEFENAGELYLEGSSKRVEPDDVDYPSTLRNLAGGNVTVGNSDFASYRISTAYDQETGGLTLLKTGQLTLEGGSSQFLGDFSIETDERLNINSGTYTIPNDNGSGTLHLYGPGAVTIGGSQLDPIIRSEFSDYLSPPSIKAELGISENGPIDTNKGLQIRSGSIRFIEKGLIDNKGYANWSGGTINCSYLQNSVRMDITPGITKTLTGSLENYKAKAKPEIRQSANLILTDPISNNSAPGSINNYGIHRLLPGASIKGGDPILTAYKNYETLTCEDGANATIDATFRNKGNASVIVTDNSILTFTACQDLSPEGTLSNGKWDIEKSSEVRFQTEVKILDDSCDWIGPGAKTVTHVNRNASLTKTTSEVHSIRMEVQGTIALVGDTVTTMPELELKNGGKLTGTGQLSGPLKIGSGEVAPGNSPGTLTIAGDTDFTSESTYSWEAASDAASDLLSITSGQATLGGVFRPEFIDNYIPTAGTVFTALSAPSISGTFDAVDSSRLPIGVTLALSYSASAVTITVGAIQLPGYDAWRASYFTPSEQADPLVSGPNADPDQDGMNNFQEYVHGTLPKSSNTSPVRITKVNDSSLEITFPWVDAATDATFLVQCSPDLDTFESASYSVESAPSSGGITQHVLQVPTRQLPDPTFARLVILPIAQ